MKLCFFFIKRKERKSSRLPAHDLFIKTVNHIQIEICIALKQIKKGEDPVSVIENLARSLTNKLIHHPTLAIRDASANGESEVINTVRKLYKLSDKPSNKNEPEK